MKSTFLSQPNFLLSHLVREQNFLLCTNITVTYLYACKWDMICIKMVNKVHTEIQHLLLILSFWKKVFNPTFSLLLTLTRTSIITSYTSMRTRRLIRFEKFSFSRVQPNVAMQIGHFIHTAFLVSNREKIFLSFALFLSIFPSFWECYESFY